MSGDLLGTRVRKGIICFLNSSFNLIIYRIYKTIPDSWLRGFLRIERNNRIKFMDLT